LGGNTTFSPGTLVSTGEFTVLDPAASAGPGSTELSGASRQALILGVGNMLMGDEGVGVAAIRRLEANGLAELAELVDGGTGGFHLLGLFRHRQHLILIDAAADGRPPGTVNLIRPRFASDFPPSLTAHDIGLKDLLESAVLLGDLPEVDLITISIGDVGSLSLELSPAVAAALPQVEALVRECL
jgi:hydrogenase maturation protease